MAVFDLMRPADARVSLRAPICIIGAGMAGLTIARRLAKAGRRVVVLESGGGAFDQSVHDLNELEDISGRYTRAMTGHYRGLGGSSTRWGGRMLPISIDETRERPTPGLPEWPFAVDDLQRYHREIEAMFGIDDGPFDEAALAGLDEDHIVPVSDPDFVARMAKWPKLRRCNLAHILGGELRAASNVEIWLNATVCDFELDRESGRLTSVTAHNSAGRELTVRADRFVVTAGTIETTRLLLWLKAQSDGRALSTPALGRYLQDHINVRIARVSRRDSAFSNRFCAYRFRNGTRRSLHLELTPAAQNREQVASAFAYFTMDFAGTALDVVKKAARSLQTGDFSIGHMGGIVRQLPFMARMTWWRYARQQLYLPADVPVHIEICAEQFPDQRNAITLSVQRDALGLPRAAVQWSPLAADERTLRAAAQCLARYWSRNELNHRLPLDWIAPCRDPAGCISDAAVDYAHPSGSARMGTDPAVSVVDPDLVCHDVRNLSVMSAAVFPSAGSANPTFTLLALALRHADYLSQAEGRVAASARPARPDLVDTMRASWAIAEGGTR